MHLLFFELCYLTSDASLEMFRKLVIVNVVFAFCQMHPSEKSVDLNRCKLKETLTIIKNCLESKSEICEH